MNAIASSLTTLNSNITQSGWIPTTWQEFLQISQTPDRDKAKFYYYQGRYYYEMGVGADHAFVNTVVIVLISLYCIKNNISIKGYTNCSYRKQGVSECQPDISYYIGDRIQQAPRNSAIVDLDENLPPDLVIEIADTSLGYDLGVKRLLYEETQVGEYWVIDVQNMKITAFRILPSFGSERISESVVLGELRLSLLEEALLRSSEMDNSQIGAWFMSQLQ
ncbi:Uma2 family endonuclease [Pseudanabaena sp. PCC 6802]|uniref:Uma2 family endonuclease n=1 Tax=Pseudanabaena sp. PCC 6802 TaxID=118173 RepID=UPI0003484658|nr:Uma2 family endonuclease [Pseudanabaena sp. PCC 6802]